MAEEQLRRLGGGRWQTRDERFTIEPQSGTWVVVDAEQHDDLGLPLVRGPFGSLADARVAIAGAREEPVPASPLAEREPRRAAAPVGWSEGRPGPRLGTLPYAPSRSGQAAKRPTSEKTAATASGSTAKAGKAPTEEAPTEKEAKPPTAKPPTAKPPTAKAAKVRAPDRDAISTVAATPVPPSDPEWLFALPSAQRSGARALLKQLEGAGLDDPAAIARAELEDDEPAIARAALERRLRSLLEEDRDPDRLVAAVLSLVSAGEDADLEVRWQLVDGDGRPLGRGEDR